jgi:RimJ/RimL family protein N-acetyltransferase
LDAEVNHAQQEKTMPHYRKLVGEKCYLSPCDPDDAQKWVSWFNDLEVTIPLGDEAYLPSTWLSELETLQDVLKQRRYVFSIIDLDADALIGRCLLFDVDQVNRKAMLGIVLGDKGYWDLGYGQDATRLLLDYAFNLLNLNSVMLGTFSFNERALACYRKVGFRVIGRRREARIIAGIKYDMVLMDILASEFGSPFVKAFLERQG